MLRVLGMDGNPFDQRSIEPNNGRFMRSLVRIVPSGNYVAGGDTLDLTNGGGTPSTPNVVPSLATAGLGDIILNPLATTNASLAATNGTYQVLLPAGAVIPLLQAFYATMKIKIYVGAGTEYVAGAYGADVLADIIQAELYWAR